VEYGRLVSWESLRSDFDGDASNRSFTSCIVPSNILRPPVCCVRSLLVVSKFLTNFWMQYFDGARLSPNSFRNAVWHALNESVCQYLRTRNTHSSTKYIFTSRGIRLTTAETQECGTQSNASHWTSPIYRGGSP